MIEFLKKTSIKATLVLAFVFCAVQVNAQMALNDVDPRIVEMYGESRTQELLSTQPQLIDYLNYYVKNAFEIVYNVPERKLYQFEDITTLTNLRTGLPISLQDLDSLNVMLLSISRKGDQYLTYKIGDTGTVVVFIAPDIIRDTYNEQKGNE